MILVRVGDVPRGCLLVELDEHGVPLVRLPVIHRYHDNDPNNTYLLVRHEGQEVTLRLRTDDRIWIER